MLFQEFDLIQDAPPRSGALNMAVDEILLQSSARPTLRLYRWEVPSLSLGYFVPHAAASSFASGRSLVRRWTGGGIVSHASGEDVTYSVIVPRAHPFFELSAGESYRALHAVVAHALGDLLAAVELAAQPALVASPACFEKPVSFDVLSSGQKVAGGAQRRTRAGLLHQGSIRFSAPPAALLSALIAAFGQRPSLRSLSSTELASALHLAHSKYATDAWLTRC